VFKSILAVCMLVVAIVAADIWWPTSHSSFEIDIRSGDSAKQVCTVLHEHQVNYFTDVCYALMKFQRSAHRLHVGRWSVSANQSLWSVVNQILNHPAKMTDVVLIEGTPIEALIMQLSQQENIIFPNDLKQSMLDNIKEYEGVFYPDTYRLSEGGDVSVILSLAQDRMAKLLAHEWRSRLPDLPINTPKEALIVASLIEEETHHDEEKPLIASVIYNRINKNMRLQIDASVHYALNKYTPLILKDLKVKHPYNTYFIKGLPPSPIALVTPASLHAALQPASTDYVFYVADPKTGKHIFNKHYSDHLGSIKKIRSTR